MKLNETNLLPAIVETVKQSAEAAAAGADVLLGLVSDTEVLEKLPVFSTAVTILTVRDTFLRSRFERNCKEFVIALSKADVEKIRTLVGSLELDPEAHDDFSDTVLSILAEGQKPIKARVIGNLLVALSNGEITVGDFQNISQVVHPVPVPVLLELKSFVEGNVAFDPNHPFLKNGPSSSNYLLLSTGLAYMSGTRLAVTDLGKILYTHGLKPIEKTNHSLQARRP